DLEPLLLHRGRLGQGLLGAQALGLDVVAEHVHQRDRVRGRRNALGRHLLHARDRGDDLIQLRRQVIKLLIRQGKPGELGQVRNVITGNGHGLHPRVRPAPGRQDKPPGAQGAPGGASAAPAAARAAWGPSSSSTRNPAPSSTGTPSARALSYFEPGLSPATTKLVLADTEEATLPPSAVTAPPASSRLSPASGPVTTTV